VVLVGNRQEGRETDEHVAHVSALSHDIVAAARKQLTHGRYAPSTLYGNGHVSEQIASALVTLQPYIQKRLHYVYETPKVTRRVG
jgi:hypothetical protein